MTEKFTATITISCSSAVLWRVLTDPAIMSAWMGGEEMPVQVATDWQLNTPVVIRGFHHVAFENTGVVKEWEPETRLVYSHLSSVSGLPDVTENYSLIGFDLKGNEGVTDLTITISNFPTEIIRKHLEFYWRGTIFRIREIAEKVAF